MANYYEVGPQVKCDIPTVSFLNSCTNSALIRFHRDGGLQSVSECAMLRNVTIKAKFRKRLSRSTRDVFRKWALERIDEMCEADAKGAVKGVWKGCNRILGRSRRSSNRSVD